MVTTIYRADARHLDMVEDASVQLVVTSPPYWGKRMYGDDPKEIGVGSLEDYVEKETRAWCREVWRVLDDRGLFFLVIGDTNAGSGGAGGDHNRMGSKHNIRKYRQGDSGLARMQSCLVPQRIALMLQSDGWLLRRWIVWDKAQVKPEDVRHVRRPLEGHEVILMLAKSTDHRYYPEGHDLFMNLKGGVERELGDVWRMRPYKGPRIGPAPYPIEIPRRAMLLATEPGMTVLDPFVGSGQTIAAAEELHRDCIGIDLYAGQESGKAPKPKRAKKVKAS